MFLPFLSAVGVAFSKNVSSSTDNIGYIIPYAIVEHFLSEYMAHGSYQGICSPGFYTQPMENPAQQQYLKVPEGASGCVVVKLEPSTEAATHLQLADVILEIEGVPIAADETVQFREDERVEYSHLISLKHVGDNLKLKILRDGQVGCWVLMTATAKTAGGYSAAYHEAQSIAACSPLLLSGARGQYKHQLPPSPPLHTTDGSKGTTLAVSRDDTEKEFLLHWGHVHRIASRSDLCQPCAAGSGCDLHTATAAPPSGHPA